MKKILLAILLLLLTFTLSASFPKLVQAQAFGFNVHSLSKETPANISTILNLLSTSCSTTIVRLWGYQSTLGINGLTDIQKVLDAAPANIQFIIALEDFPFGPAQSNPDSWFGGGYKASYKPYAISFVTKYGSNPKIKIFELMNEPHCGGNLACEDKFFAFVQDMVTTLRPLTQAMISPGLSAGQVSMSTYTKVSGIVDANSCHYYSTDTASKSLCQQEAQITKAAGKYFYIGEAGYMAPGSGPDGSCTSSSCTPACNQSALQTRASEVTADKSSFGADAFLLWQFSPVGNSTLICDKFSVFDGDPLCNGVKISLIPNDQNQCAPPAQAAGGGSLFGKLLSFFAQIPLPSLNLFAKYQNPIADINPNPSPTDYNREAGKPLKADQERQYYVTVQKPAGQYLSFFPLPFASWLMPKLSRNVSSSAWVPNYTCSSLSPTCPTIDTIRGYLGGNFDWDWLRKKREYREDLNPHKQPGPEFLQNAGVLRKLTPASSFSINAGGFKTTEDAWRDFTAAGVFNYWLCALDIKPDSCKPGIPRTDHDLMGGWVYNSAEYPNGFGSPQVGGQPTDKVGVAAAKSVWWDEKKFATVTRPIHISEMLCANDTWTVGKYFSLAEKRQVCDKLYGQGFGEFNREWDPTSIYYKATPYPLRTPPEGALYPGAWYALPTAIVKDFWGDTKWTVLPSDDDLSGKAPADPDPNIKPPVIGQDNPYSLPGGIASVGQYTGLYTKEGYNGVADFFSAPDEIKKRFTKPIDIPEIQCAKNAVGGQINDAIAGFQIPGAQFLYRAIKYLNVNLFGNAVTPNVAGATTTQGQVLSITTPPPAPPASPPPQGSFLFNRPSTLDIGVPESVIRGTVNTISDPQTGYCTNFMSYQDAQKFSKKVGGMEVYRLPTGLTTDFSAGDFNHDVNPDTVYPMVGGPLIAVKYCQQITLPYDPNGKGQNVGRFIHDMASGQDKSEVSALPQSIWGDLVSLQTRTDLTLTNTTNIK